MTDIAANARWDDTVRYAPAQAGPVKISNPNQEAWAWYEVTTSATAPPNDPADPAYTIGVALPPGANDDWDLAADEFIYFRGKGACILKVAT
ncbi:MAG: hypothetical protein AAFU41_00895 [Pseudomonadota bacterium]